ncbi:MAG TPA: Uma2 family endonuclease [Gemmatimonadales bacterium]|nr:Uma2 family endonuclease [Gemmatimonadales bacterium]
MGMAAPIYYTAEMVRALPDDGNRYEVVHGELLVTPAPRLWHQQLSVRLCTALSLYLESERVGVVLSSPADISWERDVLVQPDVFVVPVEEARLHDWSKIRHLLLAVEIVSPSSARADRFTKRRLYQERGVPLYWMVDGEAALIEVWTPEMERPRVERERVTWRPGGAGQSFTLDLKELFRPI